ncbi:carboxymuconolactone decarboxylase [Streptomyces sp. NPDC058682]|uniref:carboxymuconolactone decarboxylase n=1 Tax=unclassified Streptomyces TaxID=2593676 RepID=UPI0022596E26|nr:MULTISPECIES: carboxymuconolactone decarboxylase [unclassified Streptomyces]MCX4803846.1 carboxymuconolactone decarboxylase [Streptomyces sp. NBC_01214]
MATRSDAPVLDTLAAMTIDSIEHCSMDEKTLITTRIAALVAMDAPAISYLAHISPAVKADFTVEQLQDVLVAIAPVVGTARVMSAAGHIAQAFGVAIAMLESEAEAMAAAEEESRHKS